MNPFFFGNSAAPLYGVYHPPVASPVKSEGVLLCAPFGQEYMRSHRAYRQLALLLNKQGFPVLRFDYSGTGDSHGDLEEADIQNWISDIEVAANELIHTAQVSKISVVGLRMGGLLAAKACTEVVEVNKLVLWDSIISGHRYLDEMKEQIAQAPASKSKCLDEQGTLHFNGFALTREQLQALEAIDLGSLKPKAKEIIQICSSENEHQAHLKSQWQGLEGFNYKHVPAPGDWNFVDDFGGILLPQQIIQAIVSTFAE